MQQSLAAPSDAAVGERQLEEGGDCGRKLSACDVDGSPRSGVKSPSSCLRQGESGRRCRRHHRVLSRLVGDAEMMDLSGQDPARSAPAACRETYPTRRPDLAASRVHLPRVACTVATGSDLFGSLQRVPRGSLPRRKTFPECSTTPTIKAKQTRTLSHRSRILSFAGGSRCVLGASSDTAGFPVWGTKAEISEEPSGVVHTRLGGGDRTPRFKRNPTPFPPPPSTQGNKVVSRWEMYAASSTTSSKHPRFLSAGKQHPRRLD